MDKDPTPQQLINLFLFELCHNKATFDDAPSMLSESEIITLKVALIDGWTNIGLFDDTSSKFAFVGTNEKLKARYGGYIPDYVNDLSAITYTLERFNLMYRAMSASYKCVVPTSFAYCKFFIDHHATHPPTSRTTT